MSLRIIPVLAFVASKESRRPSSVAFESHMVSPETTGLDHALPGMDVFQRMFLVSLHWTGRFSECDLPSAVGPRNWFQGYFAGSVAKVFLPISFSAKGKTESRLATKSRTGFGCMCDVTVALRDAFLSTRTFWTRDRLS